MSRYRRHGEGDLNIGFAYILLALGFYIGFPGFHRLYMKKYGVGTWLRFIPGLGHILAFYDLLTLPPQIREANMEAKYHAVLAHDSVIPELKAMKARVKREKESPEQVILRTAKKNKGLVTPGEVALEGNIPIREAKKNLEELAAKGFIEMRVRQSGTVVYTFPEFMDEGEDAKLLDI
ncbi:MAG: TM2 domain-containing protein [Spirochaetales bacterium]|nr:TM2 domain-containing protein [Spirochaetales bacterium]